MRRASSLVLAFALPALALAQASGGGDWITPARASAPVGVTPAESTSSQHVRVKGSARLEARAARAAGKLVVSGTVVDDATHPIPGARVALGITRAGAASLERMGTAPEACSEGAAPPALERADLLLLPVDDAGRFCVRLSLPVDRYAVHLESRGSGLVDPARTELAVDLAREPVTLRFDPERRAVSLDDEEGATTLLDVVASTENDGVTTAAVGIPLTLTNEAGTPLGTAPTNESGRARFEVTSASLGPPGKGELRASFPGNGDAGASTQAMQIERRTRADLSAPDASAGILPPGSPEDGVVLRVAATERCARRGCGGSPTGTVEARMGDAIVGAAPIVRGEARVSLTFATPAASDVALRVRYVPDAPWFQPGGELAVTLPVRAPSPWRKLPLVIAGLGVVAWLVLARLPVRDRTSGTGRRSQAPHLPVAGVELVRAGPASQGWSGHLHDAHEASPIARGRVALERAGFDRVDVLAEVFSDEAGAFALPPVVAHPGDRLVAEGRLHAQLSRPVPLAGELDIALVLRRRALLDRLVAWARRRGRPFDEPSDPTPGQVRKAADGDFVVARWAEAVEQAAYGGRVVDSEAQAEVDRLAPPEPPRSPDAAASRPPRPGAR